MSSHAGLPRHAQVVVIGGGIIGCSTAYHLAKQGCGGVLLIEQETLTSGTTWHAAGVVGSLRASVFLTKLTVEACRLFPALEQETGQATGYRRSGGLSLAQTKERFEELKRIPAIGTLTDLDAELLTAEQVREKCPLLETSDLAGGLWFPRDGQTNPTDTTMAFAKGARSHGVQIAEHTKMTGLKRRNRSVTTVCTNRGDVECDQVVLCGGLWSRHLGNKLGVTVPLQAIEHMYVVTEPMADVPADQPFIRDLDSSIYIKGDAGKLLIGSVEPISKPWAVEGIPDEGGFIQLPEDWDHFEPFMSAALTRIPSLEQAGIRQFLNGPESFTVDTRHIMGPAPGYNNFYVAAGFNTTGIMSSAGVGACLAEWMLNGQPPMDTWEVDPRRFEDWASTDRFIRERTLESPGLAFAMHWPYRQPATARNVKQSVVHDKLADAGACFGVVAGWEKPMWYAAPGESAKFEYSHGVQGWWPAAAREATATRDSVALYDQSQMAVFIVEGAQAQAALQRLCANSVAVESGHVVYTQMLNSRGGIEADVTVTRLSANSYRIVTGAPNRIRDLDWIEAGLVEWNATCTDVTADFAVLSIMGPRSRELLSTVSSSNLDSALFPLATSRSIELGYGQVSAQRLSYVGELGYELFVPTEFARHVYDTIIEAGSTMDLMHAGLLCMDSCRIEKGYRHWGHELSPSVTPLEAGLGFAVDWTKSFEGYDALQKQKDDGLRQRLVLFSIPNGDPLLLHDEPIYRDGILVGETTSGAKAFRVGGSLAFGFVRHATRCTREFALSGHYELDVAGTRYDAVALAKPPYDATGTKMRV